MKRSPVAHILGVEFSKLYIVHHAMFVIVLVQIFVALIFDRYLTTDYFFIGDGFEEIYSEYCTYNSYRIYYHTFWVESLGDMFCHNVLYVGEIKNLEFVCCRVIDGWETLDELEKQPVKEKS